MSAEFYPMTQVIWAKIWSIILDTNQSIFLGGMFISGSHLVHHGNLVSNTNFQEKKKIKSVQPLS